MRFHHRLEKLTVSELPNSLWAATAPKGPRDPRLEGRHTSDICVIGGGFTGLSTALHVAEAGGDVILLEAAEPGWGASGRNGGQVIPGFKLDPDDVVSRFGDERGERLVEFSGSAPDRVFDLVRRHRIDCHARREWIHAVHATQALAEEEERARQWRDRGADVEMLDRSETEALLGTNRYVASALDRRGGWVQPLAYARGLARAARDAGARLFAASPATEITPCDKGWRIVTPSGTVEAAQVFVCTNAYTNAFAQRLWPRLARSLIPIVSYQAATEPLPDELRQTILPKGHCASDTHRLLKYFCVDPDGRLVMGGRGRFLENPGRDSFGHIIKAINHFFPKVGDAKLEFYWSGRVALTMDYFPQIYDLGPGLLAAGGYMGRGVAMATAMGTVLAERAGGADLATLPFTPIKPKPIPFHALRRPGIEAAVAWKRMLDAWETRSR
jgi:glycine/D-amino acid oxidase-like deaminating enzyme